MNRELPDAQAGFRKGRGTRDQTANIHLIIEKIRVLGARAASSGGGSLGRGAAGPARVPGRGGLLGFSEPASAPPTSPRQAQCLRGRRAPD